jgi:hypothetical protein
MQKIDRYLYQVKAGEQVTIQITPSVNLGKLYTAALDTTPLAKPADGKYTFTVNKPVGQIHFFGIEFGFLGAPIGAQYQLEIDGNGAGNAGPFSTKVVNGDPLLAKQFQFEVVQ